MGTTWVLSVLDGPHVGPMNLAIRGILDQTGALIRMLERNIHWQKCLQTCLHYHYFADSFIWSIMFCDLLPLIGVKHNIYKSRGPFQKLYKTSYRKQNLENTKSMLTFDHDDVIKWKHFPRYWPFVAGNSPVLGEFPTQRPVTRSFDVFLDLRHRNE